MNNILVLNQQNNYEENEEENECRICYEPVLEPKKYCLCNGTQAFIHQECIIKSINEHNTTYVNNRNLKKKCELCQHDIEMIRVRTWQSYVIYSSFYALFLIAFISFTYLDSVNNYVDNLFAGIIVLVSMLGIISLICLVIKYLIEKLNIYEFKITILEYTGNGVNP